MVHLYRMFDAAGRLLYIGQSISLAERLSQHRAGAQWWPDVRTIAVEPHPDRASALISETRAIRAERPIHNVQGSAARPTVWGRSTPEQRAADRAAYLEDKGL